MALTELQRPSKTELYSQVQIVAGEISSRMMRWESMADFLDKMDAAELTAMSITDAQVISDLVAFRQMLRDIRSLYGGNAVTPSANPKTVCDSIRKMLVI